MKLLIDVGNTRLKWALSNGRALAQPGACDHAGDPAAAFETQSWPQVSAVHVASVMGATPDRALAERIQARLGIAPRFARVESERDGLRVAYREPQRLGVDRWLMLLALWNEQRAPFCVVGAGSALTFDAVDAQGRHLGGVIAPGLAAMQKATLGATRFETRDLSQPYADALGTDTEGCVRQGALHACAGLIERLGGRSEGAKFIAGGDTQTLLPHLSTGWQHRPQLVLEGLSRLA